MSQFQVPTSPVIFKRYQFSPHKLIGLLEYYFLSLSSTVGRYLRLKDTKSMLPISSQYHAKDHFSLLLPQEIITMIILQFFILLFIWNFLGFFGTVILFPFSFISVLFHELGHSVMAILSGGKLISIKIGLTADNGLTTMAGGWPCLTLPAGYLFSTFIGAFMLYCAFSELLSYIFILIGGVLSSIFTLFFSQDFATAILSCSSLIGLLYLLRFYKRNWMVFWISFAGLSCSFISSSSILSSLIIYQDPSTDGYRFAKECLFGFSSTIVGLSWLILSCLIPILLLWGRIKHCQ